MKKIILILLGSLALAFVIQTGSSALDLSSIIVYPVPLNPYRNPLTIKGEATVYASTYKVKIEIFDINGDPVFSGNFMSLTIINWNGRNNNGRMVKPGLYIIKISAENLSNGDFGHRIIRILVKY